jgi:hypothetical protein
MILFLSPSSAARRPRWCRSSMRHSGTRSRGSMCDQTVVVRPYGAVLVRIGIEGGVLGRERTDAPTAQHIRLHQPLDDARREAISMTTNCRSSTAAPSARYELPGAIPWSKRSAGMGRWCGVCLHAGNSRFSARRAARRALRRSIASELACRADHQGSAGRQPMLRSQALARRRPLALGGAGGTPGRGSLPQHRHRMRLVSQARCGRDASPKSQWLLPSARCAQTEQRRQSSCGRAAHDGASVPATDSFLT